MTGVEDLRPMAFLGDYFGGSKPVQTLNIANPLVDPNVAGSVAAVNNAAANTAQVGGQQQALAQQAAQQSQSGLNQQQALVQALQAQNGLGNQSQVYGQLQDVANGTGPNPAQAMLAQATGANNANQAALMAGQRGAGSNAGLIARQAGMQGAANQQNAAGQAATMQANQSLSALGQLGGMANTQAANQVGATSTLAQLGLNQQGLQQGAQGLAQQYALAQQQAAMQNQGQLAGITQNAQQMQLAQAQGVNATNANNYKTNTGLGSDIVKGAMNGAGAALGAMAEGGEVPEQSGMGSILKENYSGKGPRSKLGMHIANYAKGGQVHNMKRGGSVPGVAKVKGNVDSYANDVVDAKLSPGEIVLPRSVTQSANPSEAAAKFVAAIKAKKGK